MHQPAYSLNFCVKQINSNANFVRSVFVPAASLGIMNSEFSKLEEYAMQTLGQVPEIVRYLGRINESLALEQFRENTVLYLGRTNISRKMSSLIAIAVSSANGQKDSVSLHFRLARKFGAGPLEILDALRAAKMVLMSNSMSTLQSTLSIFEKSFHPPEKREEVEIIINNIKKESGLDAVPETLSALSRISFDLFSEHLKEKSELMSPLSLNSKSVFLISYAVSVSLGSEICAQTYLKQYIRSGGLLPEIEDAIAISRFITGNRSFISSSAILRELSESVGQQ